MQTVADMRGVGVKNRGEFADVLCGRPLKEKCKQKYLGKIDLFKHFLSSVFIRKFALKLQTSLIAHPNAKVIKLPNAHVLFIPTLEL